MQGGHEVGQKISLSFPEP